VAKLSSSKWSKHKVMMKSSALRPHLPETHWMRSAALWKLLSKYGEVILKPAGSYGGSGVIRVRSLGSGQYEVHAEARKTLHAGKEALYVYLKKRISKNYIVQKRISLAAVGSCPFDLRVMVQRHPGKQDWRVTGKLAKVAGKGYIITNVRRSHGRIVPVTSALKRAGITQRSTEAMLKDIDRVALRAAKQLRRYYPWLRTTGIDMGIDTQGRVWIIEANFAPMLGLFLKLKDKSMYKRIVAYSKGRS
jgi:hypothetical protein